MAANTKTFVVDSSFVLASLLPDEHQILPTEAFDQFCEGKISLTSAVLLPFEITNGFKMSVTRKRLSVDKAVKLLENFLELKMELLEVDFKGVLETAVKEDLTVYDAAYLWLARKRGLPLLSLDKHLQKFTVKQNSLS